MRRVPPLHHVAPVFAVAICLGGMPAAAAPAGPGQAALVTPADLMPRVRAAAAVIFNPATGEIFWGENAEHQRPIASITKVMTAIVFAEHEEDPDRIVRIGPADVRAASITYLRAGDRVRADDLLHLALVASDNAAARALARVAVDGGTPAFVGRMNEKARELGLESTVFADSSGLSPGNMSSAYDLSRLIVYASAHERIAPIMRKPSHRLTIGQRRVTVTNTNKLLAGGDVDVRGGKTGFIRKSGFCLATLLQLPHGQQVAVVVLGARSNAARFMETRNLLNWFVERTRDLLED